MGLRRLGGRSKFTSSLLPSSFSVPMSRRISTANRSCFIPLQRTILSYSQQTCLMEAFIELTRISLRRRDSQSRMGRQ